MRRASPRRRPETVLVTGAASGIGRAVALRYAAAGARLLLLDRDEPQATAGALAAAGASEVRTATADVTGAAAVAAAVADLTAGASVDRLVHCAGIIGHPAGLLELDPADVEQVVTVNLLGSFNVARAVVPSMEPGSHLALVASLAGLVAGYHYAAYSSSKFGVVGLGEALRMELAPAGIRVQVICPGEVSTPLVEREIAQGDEVLRRVKLLSGPPITATVAAERIHDGVESGRFMVIPTRRAYGMWLAVRYAPVPLRHAITDLQVRLARRAAARS